MYKQFFYSLHHFKNVNSTQANGGKCICLGRASWPKTQEWDSRRMGDTDCLGRDIQKGKDVHWTVRAIRYRRSSGVVIPNCPYKNNVMKGCQVNGIYMSKTWSGRCRHTLWLWHPWHGPAFGRTSSTSSSAKFQTLSWLREHKRGLKFQASWIDTVTVQSRNFAKNSRCNCWIICISFWEIWAISLGWRSRQWQQRPPHFKYCPSSLMCLDAKWTKCSQNWTGCLWSGNISHENQDMEQVKFLKCRIASAKLVPRQPKRFLDW